MNLSSAQRDQRARRLLMPQQEAHLVKWTSQRRNVSRSRCAQPFWRRSEKCQVLCQTLGRCTWHDTQHEEIGSPLLEAQSYECPGPENRRSSVAQCFFKAFGINHAATSGAVIEQVQLLISLLLLVVIVVIVIFFCCCFCSVWSWTCRGIAAYHDYCVFPLRGDMTQNFHSSVKKVMSLQHFIFGLKS